MKVAELWRYPVKTMGGERLTRATIGPLGVEGDRIIHAERADGRVLTSRSHPKFLGHHAAIDAKGNVTVDGRPWESGEVAADVAAIGGRGAMLVRYEGPDRFDVLPLLVATDGAIAEFGFDGRRLRANIVIGGVEGMAEREWPGAVLRIGAVAIGVQDLRLRCIMTSYDPDTQRQDRSVTHGIYERFEGKLALDCFVIAGGEIAVGDEVAVVRD
jgi:uncharacterized protein YcbX